MQNKSVCWNMQSSERIKRISLNPSDDDDDDDDDDAPLCLNVRCMLPPLMSTIVSLLSQ